MKQPPILEKRTFWDVDIAQVNFEEHAEWIINRVFDRGTLKEVFDIINFYGKEFVRKSITTTNDYLPNHSILLARAIFNLKYQDFKCSEKRPFQLTY
jgi:hypothetical protein